ncbi:MAG: PilZ domain-containing protein [Bdellovibrionota bacterium]|nr:PilZ domain-containing protein [Deltaproteobacteria bacterium]
MTDPKNRRKFARIELATQVKVVFREKDQRDSMILQNLSEGGLFLESNVLKPIGTVLDFEFRVENEGQSIQGKGIVRWVEEDPLRRKGMGIQFLELNEMGQEVLSKLYKEVKSRG